jgi:hypothetical protein
MNEFQKKSNQKRKLPTPSSTKDAASLRPENGTKPSDSKETNNQHGKYGMVYIYALVDPETNQIFYVGRSKYPVDRLKAHLNEAREKYVAPEIEWAEILGAIPRGKKDGNKRKIKWINSIYRRELEPTFVLLDQWECNTIKDANRLEDAYIAEMRRRGEPLTNVITSHRMSPYWYSPMNARWKEGYAKSPMEYIEKLKSGEIKSHPPKPSKRRYNWK